MMKIIGHRGAAGVALENSLESLQAALISDVDAVEFDIWRTKDNQFVLCHDADLKQVSGSSLVVSETNRADLLMIELLNGQNLVDLDAALTIVSEKPVIIDVKGTDWAEALAKALPASNVERINIISFHHDEVAKFHRLRPEIRVFTIGGKTALLAVIRAKKYQLTGFDVNYWTMNPLFYWFARRNQLEMITYTVNNRFIGKLFQRLYPEIAITTDYPARFRH